MRSLTAALALALALPAGAAPAPAPKAPAGKAAARAPGAKAAPKAAAKGLPFIADDYQQALAQARARNVPLVVDVWAPW